MAIPFLGEIERLITEHGSAAVLKERLSLANDQYTALERKLSDAEARSVSYERDLKEAQLRASTMEAEKLRFELQLAASEKELERFTAQHLRPRYGVLWSEDGTPHCGSCRAPITNFGWGTYFDGQVRAMYCKCSQHAIILMDRGKPIHAPDALAAMAGGAA